MPLPSPRDGMLQFLWACTKGLRGWLLLFMVLSAGIGIYEAMLFAWIGDIVDWLGVYTPQNLWLEKGDMLLLMLAVMIVSPFWIALSSFIHFQTLSPGDDGRINQNPLAECCGNLAFINDSMDFIGKPSENG